MSPRLKELNDNPYLTPKVIVVIEKLIKNIV